MTLSDRQLPDVLEPATGIHVAELERPRNQEEEQRPTETLDPTGASASFGKDIYKAAFEFVEELMPQY